MSHDFRAYWAVGDGKCFILPFAPICVKLGIAKKHSYRGVSRLATLADDEEGSVLQVWGRCSKKSFIHIHARNTLRIEMISHDPPCFSPILHTCPMQASSARRTTIFYARKSGQVQTTACGQSDIKSPSSGECTRPPDRFQARSDMPVAPLPNGRCRACT